MLDEATEAAALLPSFPSRKHFVSSLGWHLKAGYLSGRRLPRDVLHLAPDTPVLCTAWATEKPNLRRQAGRQTVTHEVPQGHLPACPGTSSQTDRGWTFCNTTGKLTSSWLNRPAREWCPSKTADRASSAPLSLFVFRISWGLSRAAVQTGAATHGTVYILCNHYLGSLLSYWITIKSPSRLL